MIGTLRPALIAAGVATAAMLTSADAGWRHPPSTTYYHAPFAGAGYGGYGYTGTLGSRYSLYGQNYGYSAYYNPPYSAYGPAATGYDPGIGAPGYGVAPYGGALGRPHGKLEYDVYTPYGKQEIEYKFRRNGRVDVDYDD